MFATLLLQAEAPITYVSQQLGHADASITLRVYAHYLLDASRKHVDLLDTQPSAIPAQPEDAIAAIEGSEVAELSGKSGDPNFRQLEPDARMVEASRGTSPSSVTLWIYRVRHGQTRSNDTIPIAARQPSPARVADRAQFCRRNVPQ